MNIAKRVKQLGLPADQFAVIGSGTMDVLGLRPARDIDITCSETLHTQLLDDPLWQQEERYGKIFLLRDDVEMNGDVSWDAYARSTQEIIDSALVVDGVRFMNVTELIAFKTTLGRDKDIDDIEQINQYKRDHCHEGVYGIVERDSMTLMITKSRGPYIGMLDLPGGSIEDSETHQEALVREFTEEVGCTPIDSEYLGTREDKFTYTNSAGEEKDFHHIGHYYRVVLDSECDIKTDPDGHDSLGCQWIDQQQINNHELPIPNIVHNALSLIRA